MNFLIGLLIGFVVGFVGLWIQIPVIIRTVLYYGIGFLAMPFVFQWLLNKDVFKEFRLRLIKRHP